MGVPHQLPYTVYRAFPSLIEQKEEHSQLSEPVLFVGDGTVRRNEREEAGVHSDGTDGTSDANKLIPAVFEKAPRLLIRIGVISYYTICGPYDAPSIYHST